MKANARGKKKPSVPLDIPKTSTRGKGRPRTANERNVLLRAMELFWAQGYFATSVDALCEVTGLKPSSLYAMFESKRNLYKRALAMYAEEVVGFRRNEVEKMATPLEGIKRFFELVIESATRNSISHGCLNTNNCVEFSTFDKDLQLFAKVGVEKWINYWSDIITTALAAGTLKSTLNPTQSALALVTLTQGLNVISKVKPERQFLQEVVASGLSIFS